jgi:hypothetical protein
MDDHGVITRYKDLESGKVISAKDFERQQQVQSGTQYLSPITGQPQAVAPSYVPGGLGSQQLVPPPPVAIPTASNVLSSQTTTPQTPVIATAQPIDDGHSPLIQPGAKILGQMPTEGLGQVQAQAQSPVPVSASPPPESTAAPSPTPMLGKNLRMEGLPHPYVAQPPGFRTHGFLDATSIAILIPTLVILTLIIAAAHKKRLFPWQTLRPFNPPTGLMTPREYERSYLCPPNARRSGKLGKRDPNATWTDEDGTVLPFGFLARTHLPVTIPLGRLPNKNMFIVALLWRWKQKLMILIWMN